MPTTAPEKLRDLAPAAQDSGPPPDDGSASKGGSSRRKLVKSACRNCQTKKTKCNGKRPKCSRCLQKGLACQYDTLYEGMSKQQSAEYEILRLNDIITDLEQKLRVLEHGSQQEAFAMLNVIRRRAAIEGALEGVDDRSRQDSSSSAAALSRNLDPSAVDVEVESRTNSTNSDDFIPLLFNRQEWADILPANPNANSMDPTSMTSRGDDDGDGDRDDDHNDGSSGNSRPRLPPRRQQQSCPSFRQQQQAPSDMIYHGFVAPPQTQHLQGFGNLPFSSSISANHYPPRIQEQQLGNIFAPLWNILPITTLGGIASVKESVAATVRHARLLIQSGHEVEHIVGKKCNIAAILDRGQYKRSTLLSQWAAGLTYSFQRKTRDFVTFASMHLIWTLARWMIVPRPDTYEAIPAWLRPTMDQLFVPHVEIVDLVLWPAPRDLVVNNAATLQSDWRWLHDMGVTIDCDWFVDLELALEMDPVTGEMYLSEAAKATAEQLENWSLGPTIQQYLPVDNWSSMARIRPAFEQHLS
ncbi:uncharacterized protein JN550_012791 [Neoarthrinium moseri]|uniref:uncharacterized protein n=1 Tax=Neoarthrinium moseri TaxID=1658444 RepID=UPI001FDBF095|nr:uncharacterized protein JN550_012791 [Neoarthrinium moseri]KAI1858341.1 hypothetical protein JN550_012791 [Neoarthrinium moseri]